jgi:hypothetical protein
MAVNFLHSSKSKRKIEFFEVLDFDAKNNKSKKIWIFNSLSFQTFPCSSTSSPPYPLVLFPFSTLFPSSSSTSSPSPLLLFHFTIFSLSMTVAPLRRWRPPPLRWWRPPATPCSTSDALLWYPAPPPATLALTPGSATINTCNGDLLLAISSHQRHKEASAWRTRLLSFSFYDGFV